MEDNRTIADLDGTVDEADWITVGHVLDDHEVEFIRSLRVSRNGFDYEATFGVKPNTIPDMTPNGPTYCDVYHPDGPVCTREPGHKGAHAAGNEEFIVAVWS